VSELSAGMPPLGLVEAAYDDAVEAADLNNTEDPKG
jgi:hypothetical protein